MPGLLDGYRVLDLTWGIAGPAAGMLLADNGADVIKVEPPGGDPYRSFPPYHVWNRGKRSVILDLKSDDGYQRLLRLVATADVVMVGFRPAAVSRLRISYADLRPANPDLVYLTLPGYNPDGPNSDRPGYEPLVSARLGLQTEQQGYRPGPHFQALPTASYGAALLAVTAIASALCARSRSGLGQEVVVSLEDGVLATNAYTWMWAEDPTFVPNAAVAPRLELEPVLRRNRGLMGNYLCADGKYIAIHTGARGAFWRTIQLLGLADGITPPDSPYEALQGTSQLSIEEAELIQTEVPARFLTAPRHEWLARFEGIDVACMPVDPPGAVLNDAQVIHNGSVAIIDDPELGPIKTVGALAMIPDAPPRLPGPAPTAGQHTIEVLAELDRDTRSAGQPRTTGKASLARGPLDGIRILDFGAYFAGPYGPKVLGDLGADVIKIEPVEGDAMRSPVSHFITAHRGKRSIAVNLKASEGAEIARRLIATADVVAHNMRPAAAARLGLDETSVRAIRPDVVYLSAPGWGPDGPKAHLQSFAPLFSGYCGIQWNTGGEGNPPVGAVGNEDYFNGMMGASLIAMGLARRLESGAGVGMVGPQLTSTLFATSEVIVGVDDRRIFDFGLDSEQNGWGPLCRIYQTADGWICLVVATPREWEALCRLPGFAALADDPRFAPGERNRNATALATELAARFRDRPTAAIVADAEAVGLPCEPSNPYQGSSYLFDDASVHSQRVVEFDDPTWGRMRGVGLSMHFGETPGTAPGGAPLLGQQTREILAEIGYTPASIDDLKSSGVVTWATPSPSVREVTTA